MGIASRIEDTLENWRTKWGKALNDFLINILRWGLETLMNVLGQAFAPKLKPLIDMMEESGEIPPELQPLLNEIKAPTGQVASIIGYSLGGGLIGGAMGKITDALFGRFGYWISSKLHPLILSESHYLPLWRRGDIKADELTPYLRKLGFDDDAILHLQKLSELRLDPATITNIWLRDKVKYEKYWKDLFDQGWSPDRMEIAKELAKIIPPLADMVRFADFSAFDPEVIARWREFYDAPSWIIEPMSLIGITNEAPRDWANKYWFSHFRQPGRFELGDMFRRGLLGKPKIGGEEIGEPGGEGEAEATIKLAYKTMGYSSFWQDALLELVREIPTRVDVRRWWDMRTIDEAELKSIYQRQGYFGKDLENYILWTKVYVAFPDLIARFKNGWISEGDVRSELTGLGMLPERVEEMWQTKFKKAQPERVASERTATATEIMKGVKKGIITWEQGVERLGRMGYSAEEAEFKLKVYIGVTEGSPETYMEFVDWTERYRQAQGLEAHIPSINLIEADKAMVAARIALREAESQKKKGEELAAYQKALSDAEYRYRALLVSWEEEKKKTK